MMSPSSGAKTTKNKNSVPPSTSDNSSVPPSLPDIELPSFLALPSTSSDEDNEDDKSFDAEVGELSVNELRSQPQGYNIPSAVDSTSTAISQ
jgi:hypothetical protein